VTVFFVENTQHNAPCSGAGILFFSLITWKRALAVALFTVLACLLHCAAFMWYTNRPAPLLITEAKALPMIDIALAAPSAGAPEEAKPLPPKPMPPKPKAKPVVKPKPKPPKEKIKAEVKKPVVKPEQPAAAPTQPSAPVKDNSRNNPVVGSKADSTSKHSESGKVTQARAFAAYLNNPKPHYPGIARSRHWEGLVLLRVYVTPDGRCGNLNVARSSGHDVLDETALEAVRNWRFVPAKRGDSAFASWVSVPIEFSLRD
jgi:periplasmic protein TonB